MKIHRCNLLLLAVSAFFGFSHDLRAGVAAYDLSAGFSATSNPNGPWAYGWKGTLGGAFTLLTVPSVFIFDSGVRIPSWQLTGNEGPLVYVNNTTNTATSGSVMVLPPGTMVFGPGQNGRPENFGVIRFTVPAGGSGNYEVKVAVAPAYNNGASPQGDSDFHLLKNGVELFGQNLAPTASTGYSNTVSLSEGDTVEFVIGRGPDGNEFGAGRKIAGSLSMTNTPPPPPAAVYDLAGGFSTASNPNGPWAYGWKGTIGGAFSTLPYGKSLQTGNGVPIFSWELSLIEIPGVTKVIGPGTAISASGQFVAPAGTVYFTAGSDGTPQNFGVVRFTVPAGGAGNYRIETSVRDLFDGSFQGDTDFHVAHNGVELFGQFLPVHQATSYSNVVVLAQGDTVDFLIGRGQDGHQAGSGLKIAASLTATTNTPPSPSPTGSGLVVPNELANADAAFGSGSLFDAGLRNQQVYGASEFGSVTGAILITELRFRPDYLYGHAFTATVANIQFNLSTTARVPEGLSSTYANNVGADDTVVFSGPLNISSSFSGPASGPKAFDIIVPFSRGFVYNPAAGNLLVDIRNFSGSTASLVAGQGVTGYGASRVAGGVNAGSGTPGNGADALLIVYAPTNGPVPPSPSHLRVVSITAPSQSVASVPIEIGARGDENAFSFSLNFNPALLAFRSAAPRAGLAGATLIVNSNDAGAGRIGFALALSASTALPPGTQELVRVEFQVGPNPGPAPVDFGNAPVSMQVADALARPVPAVYTGGSVTVAPGGFEADVSPRPGGDRTVEAIDWVQVGRFAANLDTPAPGEFVRADCAPRATGGNGMISAADFVQAGRYVATLDPLTPAGGPMAPAVGLVGFQPAGAPVSTVSAPNVSVAPASIFIVPVRLEAEGSENALGLSIVFDPSKMSLAGVASGADAASASLNLNTSLEASGKLGMLLGLSPGQSFGVGTKEVLLLNFVAAGDAAGSGSVSFNDDVVLREVADMNAQTMSASFVAGTVTFGVVTPPGPPLSFTRSGDTLLLAWPASAAAFELEGTAGPLGTPWTAVSSFTLGEQKMAIVPISAGQRYFRLKKP